MTLDFLVMGFAGVAWGAARYRLGTRVVVLTGAIILGAGLWFASRATSPLMFQLGFGVFVGVACGAFISPMIAAVTAWFDTQRALAGSPVSAGMGMAPMTMSPFASLLVSPLHRRTTSAVPRGLALVV